MAFAHNAMLRGLNSLYLQADLSDPKDISDFLFFLRSWAGWVSHHHVLEEERMFPQFEKAMKQPNFLQGNVEEHHIFQPILKKLLAYADTKPEEYQASTVRSLIEEMAPSFREHLAHEITSLLSMAPYDGPALLKVYKGCEAEASRQDKVSFFYVLFCSCLFCFCSSIALAPFQRSTKTFLEFANDKHNLVCGSAYGSWTARYHLRGGQPMASIATAGYPYNSLFACTQTCWFLEIPAIRCMG